ncbi:MAG: YesL family protein [Blautia sp.]|nr:YesL family protein [Blautia sp.]
MRFFSYDNPVWRFLLRVGNIWILNMIWLLVSLPVFTLGASTTALIYSCMKLQKDEGYPIANFFHSFKDNFRQATVIWLLYAAVGALLAWGLIFWNQTDRTNLKISWALVLALLIPWLLSLLYVFAVQSKFVNTVKNTIHYAVILCVKHWKYTLQMVVVLAAVCYFNLTSVVLVNFITLVIGVGLVVYLFSFYYARIFDNYIKTEEPLTPEEQYASGDSEEPAGRSEQDS